MHRRHTARTFREASTTDRPEDRRLPRFTSGEDDAVLAALFLGPRAENEDLLARLVGDAVSGVAAFRRSYLPGDPVAIGDETRASAAYQRAVGILEDRFHELLALLDEHGTPYFAPRYQAHMLWDTLLAGTLGYFATMLHNPNNVTVQASTLTTFLELLVGWDLCTMFGLPFSGDDRDGDDAWGHITADGTVANIEAAWSTRELKFLPLAIRGALAAAGRASDADDVARHLGRVANEVEVASAARSARIVDLSTWELLNVPMAESLALPSRIAAASDMAPDAVWDRVLAHAVSAVGLLDFYRIHMDGVPHSPVILTPSTRHYSWPKALSLLGGGGGPDQLVDVAVDADARLDLDDLRARLDEALTRRLPVMLTVAVMGSTEEGACDPLDDVLQMRDDFRRRGLDFNVHADAAWGGYLASVIRKDFAEPGEGVDDPFLADQRGVHLSAHTRRHLQAVRGADSVTVDPHKMGYIPYPAGALCYADERMRNLVTFGAPVIGSPGTQVTVGEFGIEGSKPGAAAAAVFLAHSVLRPSASGYGRLVNAVLASAKSFYLRTFTLASADDPFLCVPLARLPVERDGVGPDDDWEGWARRLAGMGIVEIESDPEALAHFNELGPDENIVDYAFNPRRPDGTPNRSIERCNRFNRDLYDLFHVQEGSAENGRVDYGADIHGYRLLIAQTEMTMASHGEVFMRTQAGRLGLDLPPPGTDFTLVACRTVVMNPWLADMDQDGRPFLDELLDEMGRAAAQLAGDDRGA